jgi:hypothetical protein
MACIAHDAQQIKEQSLYQYYALLGESDEESRSSPEGNDVQKYKPNRYNLNLTGRQIDELPLEGQLFA